MTTALEVVRDGDVLVTGELRHVFVDAAYVGEGADPGRRPRRARRVGRVTNGARRRSDGGGTRARPCPGMLRTGATSGGTVGSHRRRAGNARPAIPSEEPTRAQDPCRTHERRHAGARARPGDRRRRRRRLRSPGHAQLPAAVAEQRVHGPRRPHRHRPPGPAARRGHAEEREGRGASARRSSTGPTASAPARAILTYVPGLNLKRTGAVPVTDLRRSQRPRPADRARQRDDADARARVGGDGPRGQAASDRLLIIHPAKNLKRGQRYIVGLGRMRDASGRIDPRVAGLPRPARPAPDVGPRARAPPRRLRADVPRARARSA